MSMTLARAMLALALALAGASAVLAADPVRVTIGTGGFTGVYYPAGGAICRMMQRERRARPINCAVASTEGSAANVAMIRAGDLDFGVIQSDVLYRSLHGLGEFEDAGAFDALRAVFAIHLEPFTVVARADAGVARFEDLKGLRVNVGSPRSGQRSTMETVMAAYGWTMDDFSLAAERDASAQSRALCENRFDAMVFVVGHPNGSVQEATTACDARLVGVAGPRIDALIAGRPYYRAATIPGGMYIGNPDAVPTFGVGATVVTSNATPDDVVYALVSAVFRHLEVFRGLHPAFQGLDRAMMARTALSAPIHPGAARYYAEAGLD